MKLEVSQCMAFVCARSQPRPLCRMSAQMAFNQAGVLTDSTSDAESKERPNITNHQISLAKLPDLATVGCVDLRQDIPLTFMRHEHGFDLAMATHKTTPQSDLCS